jgi:predicted membrane protein
MEGNFRFNMPFLRPAVRYDDSSFRGTLIISQKAEKTIRLGSDMENNWDIKLNDDTPIELELHMGAGESRLNLGALNLRRVEVHMGVGEMTMDLRGTPRQDYDVDVRGGVGEATIYLPRDASVVANAKGGIGQIETRNLRRDGSRYVNEAYGKAARNVSVDVSGGVGEIHLISN